MAANVFTGATDNNWSVATNWSQGTVPTATDTHTVTFNATSPNCTVNITNRVCNSIDFTGYTNVLTMTFNITVSGAITFQANQSSRIAGTGVMSLNVGATITSNGGVWNNIFTFSGAGGIVCTLADNMTVTGLVQITNSAGCTINGNKIICQTSLSMSTNVIFTGTTTIEMTGTGTLGGGTGGGYRIAALTIKSTANITLTTNLPIGTVFTVEAGAVVVTTGNTLLVNITSTLNTSEMGTSTNAWNAITIQGTSTGFAMTSNVYCDGLVSFTGATQTIGGAGTLVCRTSLNATAGPLTGATANIELNGTGTWTTTSTGSFKCNVTIKSTANITFGTAVNWGSATFTVEPGATVTTTGNTFSQPALAGTSVFNVTPMGTTTSAFNNWSLGASASTMTLLSDIYVTGNLTGASTTFNGFNIYVSGNVTSASTWGGTSVLNMVGTGTFGGGVFLGCPLIFNTAGTYSFTTFGYRTSTITFTAGTFNWGTTQLTLASVGPTMTVNTNIGTIPTLVLTPAGTPITINGTNGFSANVVTVTSATTSTIVNFKAGNTYIFNTSLTSIGASPTVHHRFQSDSPGVKAIIYVPHGGTVDCGFFDGTDIDSSLGKPIYSYKGIFSNCNNWFQLPGYIGTLTS